MTTENASTDAPVTEQAAPAADAITSPAIAAAKAALDSQKPEEQTEEKTTTETTTEEQSPEDKAAAEAKAAEDAAAEEAKAKEGETKGAPEKYEFQFDEGVIIDEPTLTEFTDIAKAANLDQETAQKLANIAPKLIANMQAAQLEAMTKVVDGWADQTRADKELGNGDKAVLDKTLAVADKAMQALATPELRALLNKFDAKTNPNGTGLGNHPEFIRLMYRAGMKTSEDKIVTGHEPGATQRSHADRLYGNKK